MDFKCYYCEEQFDSLRKTADHLNENHSRESQNIRQLTLNDKTREKVYVTKGNYGTIGRNVYFQY